MKHIMIARAIFTTTFVTLLILFTYAKIITPFFRNSKFLTIILTIQSLFLRLEIEYFVCSLELSMVRNKQDKALFFFFLGG
jgi:hypothetical protein